MNIAFLHYSYPGIGGTETVTNNLAKFFESKGHHVTILSWKKPQNNIQSDFEIIWLPDQKDLNSETNSQFIYNICTQRFNCLINQGPFWIPSQEFNKCKCLIVSVLHYAPDYKIKSQLAEIDTKYHSKSPSITHFIKSLVRYWFKDYFAKKDFNQLYRKELSSQITNSDLFVVLCPQYISELNKLMNRDYDNIYSIQNGIPSTISYLESKEKKVVYIGRLSKWDKRVDRLLKIWQQIERKHNDWNLEILGDGDEKKSLMTLAGKLKLKNCSFEGFVNVSSYLKKASILTMTSSSEGYPMVILECQCHGVVPIAYNVSSGIENIIKDEENGFLISPFDSNAYIKQLLLLIEDDERRKLMSHSAMENAKMCSVEKMGKEYLNLIINGITEKQRKN